MKLIFWSSRSVVGALMLAIVVGVGVAAPSSTAQAQDRYGSTHWDRGRVGRYALALGYNRGYEDASQRSYRNYRDVPRWREGSEGWQDPMGNRTVFRDTFRRGYAQGFMDARAGRARRYNQSDLDRMSSEFNGGGVRQPERGDRDSFSRIAEQNGYRDGLRHGSYDANHRRRVDVDNISQFRSALNGYRPQFGDRDSYRQAYRDGFRRGYEESFHGR